MDSVRSALRAGEITKDMYERLECADCDEQLVTENDADAIGSIRRCPNCGQRWRQLP